MSSSLLFTVVLLITFLGMTIIDWTLMPAQPRRPVIVLVLFVVAFVWVFGPIAVGGR